jgi:hypothetical protein
LEGVLAGLFGRIALEIDKVRNDLNNELIRERYDSSLELIHTLEMRLEQLKCVIKSIQRFETRSL